jgi:hypothetical protein
MKKNKYLKAFEEYKKKNNKAINITFDKVLKSYESELIVEVDYHKSKEKIEEEKIALRTMIRETEGTISIFNGLMIPVLGIIIAAIVTYNASSKISDGLSFIISAIYISVVLLIALGVFVKMQTDIVHKRIMYYICLECLEVLEKKVENEIEKNTQKSRNQTCNSEIEKVDSKNTISPIVLEVAATLLNKDSFVRKILRKIKK